MLDDEDEQAACLRRQLMERAAEHFVRELIGQRDVLECRFNVAELAIAVPDGFDVPLMLMQQRDRVYERQVLDASCLAGLEPPSVLPVTMSTKNGTPRPAGASHAVPRTTGPVMLRSLSPSQDRSSVTHMNPC